MSVQNLREKFNQPCNGTISPPGTSFGSAKSPSISSLPSMTIAKGEPSKTKTTLFGPSIAGKVPSHFRTHSQNSTGASSGSSSPDHLLNHTPKPYLNGCIETKTTTRKSPEQSQQDIILRKWNGNGINSTELVNGNKEPSSSTTQPPWARSFTTLSKPKRDVPKYVSQLTVDGDANHGHGDMLSENGISITAERAEQLKSKYEINWANENGVIAPERAEQLKNKYEINARAENGTTMPDKSEQLKSKYEINGTADGVPKKWEQGSLNGMKGNSSFLNSVRPKMNGDVGNGNNSKSSTPVSLCNGLKKTNSSDRWNTNRIHDETDAKISGTNKVLLPTQDYSTLERKYHALQKDHDNLKREFREKNEQLTQLRTLSEAMYKEYDQLRNQYKLETSTMHQAMERATQWYKQNRELKRQSTALMQHVIAMRPDAISEIRDEVDTDSEQDNEIEALRNTIRDLTRDMSKLQAELNSIKTKENEAQDQIACLTKQLQAERRSVLSTATDALKLKDRRATFETSNQYDNVEDKLRATEVELQLALERANQAEAETHILSNKVSELENELHEIKNKAALAPPAPPAPPPPPPPPPPLPTTSSGLNGIANVVLRKARADSAEDSAAEQMADLLGIPKKAGIPSVQGGAIDDIINEIKGGRFSLKATEKQSCVKKEEPPPVIHEMMNVLGTLRRQPNRKRDKSTEKTLDTK